MGRHSERAVSWFTQLTGLCAPYWKRYRKFIVAALGAAFITLQSVASHGITETEWWMIATSAATAAGVWKIPNEQKKEEKKDVAVQ